MGNDMKKICFLLSGFQGNGGIGRVTSILANQLSDKEDLEVHTISYYQNEEPLLYGISDRVHSHVLFTQLFSMTHAIVRKNVVVRIRQILRREKIDVLIACGALYYPISILACAGIRTKCVCWEHTNPATTDDYRFQKLCRDIAAKLSWKIVVLTKSAQQYYLEHYPGCKKKLCQIYNPIDAQAARSDGYDPASKKIISVGRLSYQKNFERLIQLASEVLPRYPDWSWDIYGDGELKDKLLEMIHQNGLEKQVHLMGQVDNLYSVYKQYAFMVMTSRYEGFPMSLIEGAANQLPLVSFDIPTGPNEIIVDGVNGFLVDHNSDRMMIDRIEQLINQAECRVEMSRNVMQLVDVFSMERILAQWMNLFKEANETVS